MAMAMARTYFLRCPNLLTPFTSTNPPKYHCSFHPVSSLSFSYNHKKDKRHLPFLALASSSIPEVINVDYLEKEFNNNGVSYTSIGDSCAVKIGLENGSLATLLLPSGLITSYKPYMWHGSTMEILHTTVTEEEDGSPLIQGGVSIDFKCGSKDGFSWSPKTWVLFDVRGSPEEIIQVELSCTCGTLELTYIVSLYPISMATAIRVKNNGKKPVSLTSAILSHLKAKTRKGSAIQGLKGCFYCTHPPLSSSFELLSPAEAMKTESPGWFSFGYEPEKKQGLWTADENTFVMLKHKLSRIYTVPPLERLKRIYNTAPSKYETIDQGRELIFRVIKMGYDDIYISSPGSYSQKYGKDYFICTGPASMLVPVIVNPGEEWKGAQFLEHDNL